MMSKCTELSKFKLVSKKKLPSSQVKLGQYLGQKYWFKRIIKNKK